MDKFDSVFVQTVNNQADATFKCDRLTLFGKAVKLFNNISANRIIIFRFQINMEGFVDIIQLGRTLNNIFSFRLDFFNIFDFILIVFVANLTYDLFQQVFQCDQTGCGTVFVQNDCQIDGCFTHFDHQVCCSFVFIGKIRLTQDVAD